MATEHHSPTAEQLMEFVDGEGSPSSRAAIAAHLADCEACQALAEQQRRLSRDMAAWQVTPAPETLRAAASQPVRKAWRPSRYLLAGLPAAAAVLIVAAYQTQPTPTRRAVTPETGVAENKSAAPPAVARLAGGGGGSRPDPAFERRAQVGEVSGVAQPVPTVRALIRTARLEIVASDFVRVRAAVERIVAEVDGFADQISVSADPATPRVLRASLRVPGDRLGDTLGRLRALGQVTQDQQSAQDVSDQLVDLDARLKNARATEQRLTDLLRERTGKLSDVLEVEQELSRVRLEIERLDAEKTNTGRRVAYATIDLSVSEQRKAGLDPGPLPLAMQARVAAADGLQAVVDSLVALMLFVLRAGPALVLWTGAAVLAWMGLRRVLGRRLGARL